MSLENEAVLVPPLRMSGAVKLTKRRIIPHLRTAWATQQDPGSKTQQTYMDDVNTQLLKMRLSKASFLVYFRTASAT